MGCFPPALGGRPPLTPVPCSSATDDTVSSPILYIGLILYIVIVLIYHRNNQMSSTYSIFICTPIYQFIHLSSIYTVKQTPTIMYNSKIQMYVTDTIQLSVFIDIFRVLYVGVSHKFTIHTYIICLVPCTAVGLLGLVECLLSQREMKNLHGFKLVRVSVRAEYGHSAGSLSWHHKCLDPHSVLVGIYLSKSLLPQRCNWSGQMIESSGHFSYSDVSCCSVCRKIVHLWIGILKKKCKALNLPCHIRNKIYLVSTLDEFIHILSTTKLSKHSVKCSESQRLAALQVCSPCVKILSPPVWRDWMVLHVMMQGAKIAQIRPPQTPPGKWKTPGTREEVARNNYSNSIWS